MDNVKKKRIYLTDAQRGKFKREGTVSFLARTSLNKGGAGAVICGEEYFIAENYEEMGMNPQGEYGVEHKGWKDRSKVFPVHLRLRCRVVECRVVELDSERVPVMSDAEWRSCGVDWIMEEGRRKFCRNYAKTVLRDDRRKVTGKALDESMVLIRVERVWRE